MATGTQIAKSGPATPGSPQWNDRLSGLMARAQVRWAAMQPSQRMWAMVAAGLSLALLGVLLWLGLRTDWRVLYTGMEAEDARQTGAILTQEKIPYEVTDGGAGIRVPAPQLDKARLATAKGAMKSGRLGFEIFDKPNWVGSEFDEQVNYQRALEGELEHTVGTLGDVESARIHLVMPHDSLFRDQDRPAKATAVLKLKHRSLADGEPEAIRNLIASAVDGLKPEQVVLVDAAGHVPLGPKTADVQRLAAEQALEEKLIATLEAVTGPGNVHASVTLDYDPAAKEETQESYDPDQTVPLTIQRSEQTSGPQQVAAGVPGTATNAPNSQALPVYPTQTTPPTSAKSESGTYGSSKTVKHTMENPGRVRRLTAAILVNDRLAEPAAKGKAPVWKPRSTDEMRNLTALAQAAVGFDLVRGDMLTVQDLPFDENRLQQPLTVQGEVLDVMQKSPLLVKYGFLLAGVLVVVLFGIRPAVKRSKPLAMKKEEAKEAVMVMGPDGVPVEVAPAHVRAPLKPPEPIETDPERIRAQEIFEAVTSHLRREPTQSSRLLQSWIHSD